MSAARGLTDPAAAREIEALVARVVRRRARRIVRALRAASAEAEADLLSALLGVDAALADRRALIDLRGFVHAAELALELARLARRARSAPTLRNRAALFDAVARTPHLTRCAPRQRADDEFLARATALAASSLQATRREVAPLAAPILLRLGRLPRRRLRLPLRAPRDPERVLDEGELVLGGSDLVLGLGTALRPVMLIGSGGASIAQRGGERLPLSMACEPRRSGGISIRPRGMVTGSDGLVLTRALVATAAGLRLGSEPAGLPRRLGRALDRLARAWPEAWREVHHYTRAVVPLHESGTVSFSLRARPGYSYINVWGKSSLQLSDDLLHETSHHKLHAIEEIAELVADDEEPKWWSPWREAWRPLRGILHACYTFSYGAVMFARLLASANAKLTDREVSICQRRLLEEEAHLDFSLGDLKRARLEGRLTPAGDGVRECLARVFRREIVAASRVVRRERGIANVLAGIDAMRRQLRRRRREGPAD